MKIRYVHGDLFQSDEGVLVHGCNSRGKMGSGVARLVRDKHPEAYKAYMAEFQANGLTLGQVVWARSGNRIIGNAVTQANFGYDGALYVDYEAVRSCFRAVDQYVSAIGGGVSAVALPMIGAELGGGDWSIISLIIGEESHCFRPVVYVIDQQKLDRAVRLDASA